MNEYVYNAVNTIINECITANKDEVEITLPDNKFGKLVFLAVSDETSYNGRLYGWLFSLYDNNKIGRRCVEDDEGVRKHKLKKI